MRVSVFAFAIAASGPASADLIDFESIPGIGLPSDDQAIGNAFNTEAFDYVTFAISRDNGATLEEALFEAVGDDSVDGYVYDQGRDADVEHDDFAGAQGLGSYFLRDDRPVGQRGRPLSLFITYNQAMNGFAPTEASGQIWDIDGNNAQGTEKWDVIITDVLGNEYLADSSPEGSSNGPGSLDALPWMFSVVDLDGIAQIELRFTGTKDRGLGVAFDNFMTDTIPAPGALAALGLAGLATGRRRG